MASSPVTLSIVSPVYQAAAMVVELVRRITEQAGTMTDSFEIVLVDDRSTDDSWAKIVEVAATNPRVRGARLSRNFGQQATITAALELARGEYVIVMDCDLQHDPEEMPRLWAKAKEGYDVVLAHHEDRQHALHRNLGANALRLINTVLSGRDQAATGFGSYSLLSRKVVDAFLRFPEVHRHFLHILLWMGFKVATVAVEHRARLHGPSSYTFSKLIRLAITGMLGQSSRMLHFAMALGAAYCFAAFLGVLYVVIGWAFWGLKEGWPSTVVLILSSTGFILFTLGIVGLYIGGIFEQVRGRPIFLIDETTVLPR